jgi:hypothetical protein
MTRKGSQVRVLYGSLCTAHPTLRIPGQRVFKSSELSRVHSSVQARTVVPLASSATVGVRGLR